MESRYCAAVAETRRKPLATTTGIITSDIFIAHTAYNEPGGRSISGGMAALSVPPR
jgi:hypothetical protein